jgi:glyoxylase-like metal-dependent hydrolase (beta-lactamase superfamily II)
MDRGALYEATAGGSTDLYYVDTEMYDVREYGAIYILDAERPALIDAGIGTHYEHILDALTEVGIAPEELAVIAPTHVHLDHAGGAGFLAAECPNAEVYVHEIGARHLLDPGRLWAGTKAAVGDQIQYYTEPKPVPEDRLTAVTDGDTIDLGDHTLEVHHAPGHAPHQAAFYDPEVDGVFTGDAAGANTPSTDGVRPLTPPASFDLEAALASVEMLQSLDPSALYYGHFGDFPADEYLAEYDTVLREWVADIEAALDRLGSEEAVIEKFVRTTDSVDIWGEHKGRGETRMNVRGVLGYLSEQAEG